MGSVSARFFDEASNTVAAVGPGIALLDVAVGRTGETGQHAKSHDDALPGCSQAYFDHGSKGLGIGDVVVGRAKQQQLLWLCRQCGQRHGRGSVARAGLQDNEPTDFGSLHGISHQEAVLVRRHTHDIGGRMAAQLRYALKRELQQAFAANQGNKLFGK